ncbi:MAG: hypothetical protein QOJ32_1468, partial [Frankiaceae bacterium]|nr:hypothetical protein [Frankiaceae bacterium]
MPSPSRDLTASQGWSGDGAASGSHSSHSSHSSGSGGSGGSGGTDELRKALDVLLDPALATVVDLVAWPDGDEIHVANSAGHAAVSRHDPDAGFRLLS